MSRRTQKNVGIIGLGIIGQRVAATLRHRGFHVFVWNRTPRPFPNFVGSPAEIAQLCDFVQIFVSDDDALLEMVQQMKQTLSAHHVVMAHSTVAPATMRAAAEIVHRRGGQFIDAPFTGSKMAAEKGELVYYVGGDDAAYRRARPVLEASSKEIIEIGEIGQATTIKLATNMVTAATVQTAAEALALVDGAGLPLEKFAEAMRSNGSNSGTLAMKLPMMIGGNFEPHFSVKHMLKDVMIATRLARSYGLSLAATEAARDSLLAEVRHERGEYDYASLIHSYFPQGPPGTQPVEEEEAEEVEEQGNLSGLDEESETPPVEDEKSEAPAADETADAPADEPALSKEELVEDSAEAEEPREVTVVSEDAAEASTAADDNGSEDEPTESESAAPPRAEAEIPAEPAAEHATTAVKTEPETAPADKNGERRGFFSRMFSRDVDY